MNQQKVAELLKGTNIELTSFRAALKGIDRTMDLSKLTLKD